VIDSVRFVAGDHLYFEELVREYSPLVREISRAHARSAAEADELFQDIWIRVWRRRETYRGGPFRTWLLVIGRNLCRDRHRRSSAYTRVLEELRLLDRPERPRDPLERSIAEERRQAVRSAVDALPARQREAITARLNGGRSTQEIADAMGIAPASVRSLISKGIAQMHEELRRIA